MINNFKKISIVMKEIKIVVFELNLKPSKQFIVNGVKLKKFDCNLANLKIGLFF